jgi:hypothetical protein
MYAGDEFYGDDITSGYADVEDAADEYDDADEFWDDDEFSDDEDESDDDASFGVVGWTFNAAEYCRYHKPRRSDAPHCSDEIHPIFSWDEGSSNITCDVHGCDN